MPDNFVSLTGNLTRDPELRYTTGGRAVVGFGLAVNRRYQVSGEWTEEVSFIDCVAWADLGENVAASLTKGTRVSVQGRVQQRSWENDAGEKRSKVEVVCDDVAASLRWAQVHIERTVRDRPEQHREPAASLAPPTGGPYNEEEDPF